MNNDKNNKADSEGEIFQVPMNILEVRKNNNIKTRNTANLSRDQIINQAFTFHKQQNISEAVKYYQYFIKEGFNDHQVFSNYGLILQALGKSKEAEFFTRKAIKIKPDFAQAYSNLGTILIDSGSLKEAEISIRKAIDIKYNFATAHLNLGKLLNDLGQLEEAEISTRTAIKLEPNLAEGYANLGGILLDLGSIKEAEIFIRKAIKHQPNLAVAHANLGGILLKSGNLKEAEASAKKAIELKPDLAIAHCNLGSILKEMGKYNDAIFYYKKAIKLNSFSSSAIALLILSKREICNWNNEKNETIQIESLGIKGKSVLPWGFLYLEDNPINHLKRSKKIYKERYSRKIIPISNFKNKKIHIGYFSADFKKHATMHLISSILELHDKSKFEIYLYSFTSTEDEYTERAKNCGCIFRDIKKLSDKESVKLARKDKLDIAIDLKGYTDNNRMNIFSNRVAPIQINYLGYPGSLGAETIDYIIADNIIIPKENEKYYSEKIIRMPYCYQCNDNKKEISRKQIFRKDFNLPNNGFIFTCFNANRKISEKEFDIWMRLLKEIKGSVLWLYKSNTWAVKNLCKEAEKRNINSNRLVFASKLPLDEHLARYFLADLGLDTFNCNGHTTTSDALWSGLPVLTKAGNSFASRVSASLLNSLGIPELITYNEKEYEEKALHIARNQNKLIDLKSKVAKLKNTSTLFNSELYTRDLESKFFELINLQENNIIK